MKLTIGVWAAKHIFHDFNRDYYSVNGIEALLEYYDEIDKDMEFDPIAICCDCTEFGAHGAACSLADLVNDYGYIYTVADWKQDAGLEEYDERSYITALVEALEERTTVLHVYNGNYIVFAF